MDGFTKVLKYVIYYSIKADVEVLQKILEGQGEAIPTPGKVESE